MGEFFVIIIICGGCYFFLACGWCMGVCVLFLFLMVEIYLL